MNMWLIGILIVVGALILGPIMMLKPNAAQRGREALRTRALKMGLRVSLTSLPRQATAVADPDIISMYCLPLAKTGIEEEWLLLRTTYAHGAHFMDHWQWHGVNRASAAEQASLQHVLPQLPDSVAAVGDGPKGLCLYWTEEGGIDQLEQLLPLMQQLRDARVPA